MVLPRALSSGLPDLERGLMRILHRTQDPKGLLHTLNSIGGLRQQLLAGGGDTGIASVSSLLLRRLLEAVTVQQVTTAT